ncbi:uncharacterized protein LOC131078303 isoform X2 [Cryptomeria japonica]|uniref:uncharacterized protein LOC131078303 isoform X2 n=1 Tax=Cryptomeria japonica TaxID=3369 RepID=UPI0027DAA1DD|nr:uncharacterized protein LOC131078303 isoform X2 [Cryptomeria japonica]
MSSKPVEPQGERAHLQQKNQPQDLQNGPGLKLTPNTSSRYKLRTPRTNTIENDVSRKRRAGEHALPRPSDKKQKAGGDSCDQTPRVDDTGGVPVKLKGADPCDQRLASGADGLIEVRIKESDFVSVINRRIEVYWHLEDTWYIGNIKRYDAYNKLHHVVYDDGEEEWVSLERDRYKIQVAPVEFARLSSRSRKRNIHGNSENRGFVHRKHFNGDTGFVQKRSDVNVGGGASFVQRTSTDVVQKDGIDDGANCVQKNGLSGTTDVLKRRGMVGYAEIVQTGNCGLQKRDDARRKRLKKNSKHVKNVGVGDLTEPYEGVRFGLGSSNKSLGKVKRYDPTNKLQLVEYEDGEEEWVPLESVNNVVSREISGAPSTCTKGNLLESTDFRGSGQSEHFRAEILENAEGRLQENDGRRKRRKMDSNQVTYDVQKNYDISETVDYATTVRDSGLEHKAQSDVEKAKVTFVLGDSGINSGSVVDSATVLPNFARERKRQGKNLKQSFTDGFWIQSDSKQLKNTKNDDLQRECADSGSPLLDSVREFETQSNAGQKNFLSASGDSGTNNGFKEGVSATTEDQVAVPSVFHQRKTPAITYSRKRQHNSKRSDDLIEDESGKGRNNILIVHRTEAKPTPKGKTVEEEMGVFSGLQNDSIVPKQSLDRAGAYSGIGNDLAVQKHSNDKNVSSSSGNDSITQKQPVNAYFRRRKRSCTGNMDIMAQVKVSYRSNQSLEQIFMFSLNNLIVNDALRIHVSPLNLRQPSYCPCVAPGLQLCNRGSDMTHFELVKSQSLEDFMLLLQSLLQFSRACVQQSSSSHSALQQFRFGTLNPINLRNLSPLEFLKLITSLSDIQMQVLIVDTLSNLRKFHISGYFWEVLRNFILSLVPVMGIGAPSSTNLHVAFQSINLQISSVQGGLSFSCKLENIHWTPSAKQAEWYFLSKGLVKGESSGGRSANCVGRSLLPEQLVFERDANFLNGFQESSATQYFTSYHQYCCRIPQSHTKNDFGTFQTIPPFQMSFSSAPRFFACLHMRLSFGKGTCLDCSRIHGLVSANVNNALNSSYEETDIVKSNKHLLPGIIPNVEERAMFSRESQSSIHVPVKHVKLEENIFSIAENQRVQLATPALGFDSNVIGCVSDKHLKRYNMLPIIKIRRTNHNSWHFAGVLSPPPFVGGTSRVMIPRVAGTSNHMESSQSGGSRSTSENADDAVLRPARSRRRGRPRRQSSQEKLNEMGVNFSKLRAEIDSVVCSANILIFGRDRCWRESGAEVRLVHRSNEWVLDVKLHGSTKVTYKAQEQKVRSSQEKKQRVPGKPNCHTIIWTGGQNWSLEFPNETQWSLFRDLYEVCYNRNFRAASVKDHPTPAVSLLSNESTSTVDVPFVRSLNYIKAADDELSRTLSRSNIYDMDFDDERWLFQLNSKSVHEDGSGFDEVSEDTFERVISSLEKAAFIQLQALTIEDAIQTCSGLVPEEVLTSIYSYWLEKRDKKKDLYWYGSRGSVGVKALVPQFEMKGKESLPQTKRRGKIFRGKAYTGQHNVRTTGKHGVRNQIEMQHKKRQQRQVNVISFGSGCTSHASELQQQQDNEVSFGNACPSYALVKE